MSIIVPPDPRAQVPALGDTLAGPMSRVDGCTCGNSESTRATVPTRDGWLCSFLCSDCGRAWTLEVAG